MSFKHNAIVNIEHLSEEERKELIEKVEAIGYMHGYTWDAKSEFLISIYDKYYLDCENFDSSYIWKIKKLYDMIDCHSNTELFLAVIAIRDDSYYMQWVRYKAEIGDEWWYFINNRDITIISTDYYDKASVEELFVYFKEEYKQ